MPSKPTDVQKARKAVLKGPEKKRIKLNGHHFNFKPVTRENVNRRAGTGVYWGRISHNVKRVDDDQIDYEVTFKGRKANGDLKAPQVETKIKTALWSKVGAKAAAAVTAYFTKQPTAAVTADQAANEILGRIHGNWRKVSQGIVAWLATEFAREFPPAPKTVTRAAAAKRAKAARLAQRTAGRTRP